MLSIHSILDELVVWVNVVQDGIRVHLITRCEHDYLEVLRRFLQALSPVRSDVYASTYNVFGIPLLPKVDLQHNIWGLILNIVYAVN